MAKMHTNYTIKDLVNHKEYAFEIMDYLDEHPEELNLYELLITYRVEVEDKNLYTKIVEFFDSGKYDVYLHKQRVAEVNNTLISQEEFPYWFVGKFPQWKDLFIY